jgi:two-component system sensor histidine kinase RegB
VQGAEPAGEAASRFGVAQLLRAACADFPAERIALVPGRLDVVAPRNALQQAVAALVKNALEAGTAPVTVAAAADGETLRITVSDQGAGMDEETLRRIAEPFFTTKEPGRGMGLGTFLARTVAERLGGRLTYQSAPGQGTTAVFELPGAATVAAVRTEETRA